MSYRLSGSSNRGSDSEPCREVLASCRSNDREASRDGGFTPFILTTEEALAMTPRADMPGTSEPPAMSPGDRRRPTRPGRQGRERISRRKTVIQPCNPARHQQSGPVRIGSSPPRETQRRPPRQRHAREAPEHNRKRPENRTPPTRGFCRKREYPCAFSRKSPTGRAGT